ncbi:HepT-like ribonuclease domain-containing protein [Mesorhizobium sp. CN2-181]|uniref:HepT-like ribonuclease domain-containing protein n=1 Tax=Mesorhizobium yinganensis TaxID=3157707 RepID=UPI0032B7BE93
MSEASRCLPATIKDRHPEIPWQQIAGAGNIYRHGYNVVSVAAIWQTSSTLFPPCV